MVTAEELLAGAGVHEHPVPDTDTYFVIDPITRQIENTNRKTPVVMQYDHNSERFTFEIPRYVDGHDMLLCTSVTVNVDNIETETETTNSDAPDMVDLSLHPNDPEKVISSWLISRNSTQLAGILSFHIEYKCVDSNGDVVYEWSTDTYSDVEVKARKKNGEVAVIEHTDLLEQWRSRIFGAGDSVMANIATEGVNQVTAVKNESTTQQAAIELKGSETLATIPDEYTELYNLANSAERTKSDAITCEAEGTTIVVNNASDDYVRGLKIYGKSTQVTTTGAQLANLKDTVLADHNGLTWTCKNGVITVNGTTTALSSTSGIIGCDITGFIGTFHISGNTGNVEVYVSVTSANGSTEWYTEKTFTLNGAESKVLVYCQVYLPNVTVNATVYPMLCEGDVELPWEPYTGGKEGPNPDYPQEIVSIENPIINLSGKNLARSSRDGELKSAGLTVTQINNSSEIVVNGATTAATSVTVLRDIYLPAGQYTLSVYGLNTHTDIYDRVYVMDGSTNALVNYVQTNRPQTFTISNPRTISISLVFAEASIYDNRRVSFQLERGISATEYEPYKPVQSIDLNHTLRGIPLSASGTYVDRNGTNWIRDEIDFERGVLIKRVERIVVDGTAEWHPYNYQTQYYGFHIWDLLDEQHTRTLGLCNQFETVGASSKDCLWVGVSNKNIYAISKEWYDKGVDAWKAHLNETPLEIIYARKTPIETPLTAEEIEAFKSIKTNYPNTTILNDSGAWMKTKYNADTKTYIENPKTLKLVDSSTGVVYELKIVNGSITVVPI